VGDLAETVIMVTGASRGIGKGIALGLGEAGATVYVTGRSTDTNREQLGGTIDETAAQVTQLGGAGVAVQCDHRIDSEVAAAFERIVREVGRLDVLVNNAFASPDQRVQWGGEPFWEIPASLWDDVITVGLRSHFVASRHAVRIMLEQGGGLILNVGSRYSLEGKTSASPVILPYSVGKAGVHRLTADMAVELQDRGITVIEILPPATRTEGVVARADTFGDISTWHSAMFTGKVLAAFLAGGDAASKSGSTLRIVDLAVEFDITDTPNS